MSNYIRELAERQAMRSQRASQIPDNAFIAKVLAYDPTHDAIKVNFDHVSPTQSPNEPHWVPILRQWVGNSYGFQAGPEIGMLAVILTMSRGGDDLCCIGWYYNDNAQAPAVPSKEAWLGDNKGNTIKLTQDGGTAGDGNGGIKLNAPKYMQHVAGTGGGALSHTFDVLNNKLTHQLGTLKTIFDGNGNAISHVAPTVAIGDLAANMSAAANAAINVTHLQNTVNALRTQARSDLQALCSAMISAGVPNSSTVFSLLAALSGVNVSSYSNTVLIK